MKKSLLAVIILSLFVLGGCSSTLGGSTRNICSDSTVISTTTSATVNKKLLDVNTERCGAVIVNNSDTAMYLYMDYIGNQQDASTTCVSACSGTNRTTGFYLAANGGSFKIDSAFNYTNQVWLGTTTADKVISVTELE